MRITCGLDLIKQGGCGLLRHSLGFSHLKNIRKIKSLHCHSNIQFVSRMQGLLMIRLRRGKLGKPRAKSQPLETNGNYVTQKESLISRLHS